MDESKKLLSELHHRSKKASESESSTAPLTTLSDFEDDKQVSEGNATRERVISLIDKIILNGGWPNHQIYAEGCDLLSDVSSSVPYFTNRWKTQAYEEFIYLILLFWLYERKDNVATKLLYDKVFKELTRRRRQDKDRIRRRPDRVDKIEFQAALAADIQNYSKSTIEDAITDLRTKYPHFKRRRRETLRNWAKPLWPVPTKSGRPKKNQKD